VSASTKTMDRALAVLFWVIALGLGLLGGRCTQTQEEPPEAIATDPTAGTCWRLVARMERGVPYVELQRTGESYSTSSSIPFASPDDAVAFARLHRLEVCGLPAPRGGVVGGGR
jgi:hypothetical protein